MFQSVDTQFVSHSINWDNCLAIGLGKTNANIDDHNSIRSRVREKNESIIHHVRQVHHSPK